jgi:branched-chain amino acid transport system ATP-binding protein
MLSLREVHVHIGKLHILQGVSLEVKSGESAALLGRNGVGKTTTLRSIMGLVARSRGVIEFDGFDLARCQPHIIPRRGIGYVPQGRGIFPTLSVLENLCIGLPGKRDQEREEYVFSCFPRLKERLKQAGNTLSGGEQQMLAIARILRTGAKLLLLDEISEGLAPVIVQTLGRVIRTLKERGYTIIMVEQNFRFAAPLADRHYVIEHGSIVETVTMAELDSKMDKLHVLLGV